MVLCFGMEGGTLWILLCNIMVYLVIKKYLCFDEKKQRLIFKKQSFCEKKQRLFKTKQEDVLALLVIFIPIVCSILMWYGYKDEQTKEKVSVVVVQPNLDPYEEQYSIPPKEVVDRIENLTLPLMDDSVDYIVCPESCIQEYAWEDELAYVPSIKALRRFANNYKKAEV
jgi:apolipoprotein N-acyltransferase